MINKSNDIEQWAWEKAEELIDEIGLDWVITHKRAVAAAEIIARALMSAKAEQMDADVKVCTEKVEEIYTTIQKTKDPLKIARYSIMGNACIDCALMIRGGEDTI